MTSTSSLLHAPLTLPTNDPGGWLARRTRAALERGREFLTALKEAPAGTEKLLELWNDLELALGGVAAIGSTFTELHTDPAARREGETTLQEVDRFVTEMSLDPELYDVFRAADADGLSEESARLLREILRDFRRAGVDKDEETRARIAEIADRMVVLGQDFARNIRNDVRSIDLTPGRLAGMPEDWIAEHPARGGVVTVTTDYPDAVPFFTFARDREARHALRKEFLNRAWPENDAVLRELFALRREHAELVGYENWADYDAEVKMIGSGAAIKEFIDAVAEMARESAERDYAIVLERLREDHPEAQAVSLADKDYYAELVRKERFGVDAGKVREYFSFDRVVQGMLDLTERLFEIRFTRVQVPVWHEDVQAYDVTLGSGGEADTPLGRAYLDLHPREGKFGHAAQFSLVDGIAGVQLPEGVLGCNFGRGFLDHDDVVTLFHEFGHLLHHLLAGRGRYARFSGVATEWDFVEAPSQMLEEWAWDPQVLATFAINADGEPLPADLAVKMRAAEDFGKGFDALTQMFYAALSYAYHVEPVSDLTGRLVELQEQYSLFEYIPGTHMMANFGHLDGYSSGYYTYMWSLVIAKDMFSAFDGDLFNPRLAARYRDGVLAPGGTRDAAELVTQFLGRPYSLAAFRKWLSA